MGELVVSQPHQYEPFMGFIPPSSIRTFLARPRDDCRPLKDLSLIQLEDWVTGLQVRPLLWDKLKHHQKVGFLLGVKYHRFALFYDMGTGKTMIAIALARYLRYTKVARSHLVLVPNRVLREEWAREIEKHAPSTSYRILSGSSEEKWQTLEDGETKTLTITTYAGLTRMVSNHNKKKNRLELDPAQITRLAHHVDGLFLDESNVVGEHSSLQHRLVRRLSKSAKTVFALAGTPFGSDPTPLWGQMMLIDGGQSLGETLGLFRAAFFNTKINYWGGYEHTFKAKMKDELHRILAHRSLRVKANQADLPDVSCIVREATLPTDARTYYDQWKATLIASKGNYVEQRNAFLRMRQISSGFIGYVDDDTGAKAQFAFDPNPKLELLLSIIQGIDEKIIVFNEYVFSGALISKELTKLKIPHVRVYGGTKHPDQEVSRFVKDPKCRVLILQNAQSYGINAQVVKYGIFYESPVSPIIRKQATRRVERQGSSFNHVFIYDLITRSTLDQHILNSLKDGEDLFQAVVEGKARV